MCAQDDIALSRVMLCVCVCAVVCVSSFCV